ncbi:hypothetical protein Tsubulata_034471 [Turnera subulata]|uniref:Uncharacterized protein n=1 Tax=Turnera subulata TaxID=218843 RepID=A0A9Q0F277_9ROSI|nr:hypothetical protein Tsubulata_034471 [Turnera subulata]
MRLSNKAGIALMLGAVFGVEDPIVTPKFPVILQNLKALGSQEVQVKHLTNASDATVEKGVICDEKCQAAEKSLRMVMYLSCWGPN